MAIDDAIVARSNDRRECVRSGSSASNQNEHTLRAINLKKVYHSAATELVVFCGVCLEVAQGQMLAIVGESGSGKSTLLHILSGLDRPSEGDVYFGPRSLGQMDENRLAEFRNREIGFVWQFHYLLPEFTAVENVMMPLIIGGKTEREAATVASEWLGAVGLRDRAGHRSGELSGGEQQRVAIARALVGRPRYLMADEPTGNLDEGTGAMVFDLIQRLHREYALTSIIVTHNQTFASRCDRVLRLHSGALTPFAKIEVDAAESGIQLPG